MLAKVHYHFGRPPKLFWYILFMLFLIYLLSGCKTTEYIEVPKIETKIEYRDRVERDTTFVKDSVYVREKNDTIYVDKYKYIYKEHLKVDTAFVYKTDTITRVITKEKQLSKWESFKLSVGGYVIAFLVILIIGSIIYVVLKFIKR